MHPYLRYVFFVYLFLPLLLAGNVHGHYLFFYDISNAEPLQGVLYLRENNVNFSKVSNVNGLTKVDIKVNDFSASKIYHPMFEVDTVLSSSSDTIVVGMRPRKLVYTGTMNLEPYNKLVSRRADMNATFQHFHTEAFRKTFTRIDRTTREIPYVSGRFFPGKQDTGIVFLSKVHSNVKRIAGEISKEEVINKRDYGLIRNIAWRESADYIFNPFQRFSHFKELSYRGYLSPLVENFDNEYYIDHLGYYKDSDYHLYKVRPKNPYEPLFHGYIIIDAALNHLVYIDWKLDARQQIEMVDSVRIMQYHHPSDTMMRPIYTSHSFYFDIFNNSGEHRSEVVYADFNFLKEQPPYSPLVLNQNQMEQLPEMTLPFYLTPNELRVMEDDLSYRKRWESGEIADSLQQYYSDRPFQTLFIKGMNLPFYKNKHYVRVYPLWFGTGYNVVEGFYTRFIHESNFDFQNETFKNTLDLRLGFGDVRLKFRNLTEWDFNLKRPGKFALDFGNYVFQFNEAEPILPVINTFYSLFLGRNFLRLYNKEYARVRYKQEVVNGLTINANIEYGQRSPLFNLDNPINMSGASWNFLTSEQDFFNNNNMGSGRGDIIGSDGFDPHRALVIDMDIVYQFRQRYKMINGRKVNVESDYPKVYMQYKKGIPWAMSITDYDYLAGGIGSTTRLKKAGTTRFDLSGGGFLNRSNVPFVDFKHFNGLQTIFLQRVQDRFSDIKQFRTMRYYDFSTDRFFLEAHLEHNFGGYVMSKIPWVNRANLHLVTGFNYLSSEWDAHFFEMFFGFDNIFKVAKIEFSNGWDDFRVFRFNVRVGVNFDYNFYRNNKRR
ncbi:MAG: DUF5686 family protein [Cryomorphaceae bacterium]|nr:DUF5686 family protein [Cryomorphaceae bacterium]